MKWISLKRQNNHSLSTRKYRYLWTHLENFQKTWPKIFRVFEISDQKINVNRWHGHYFIFHFCYIFLIFLLYIPRSNKAVLPSVLWCELSENIICCLLKHENTKTKNVQISIYITIYIIYIYAYIWG